MNRKKNVMPMSTKLRKGDSVRVIAGKHKGTNTIILKILTKTNRVVLDGLNVKKHLKPSQTNQEGGIVDVPASIHISNVMLLAGKGKSQQPTRIKFNIQDGQKNRIAVKTGDKI